MKPETPSRPNGLPGAQVARALKLVSYQDGAVVSREIVKKPTGSVTLFAFDEGQGLSEHTAPFSMCSCMCSKARRKSASLASRITCITAR